MDTVNTPYILTWDEPQAPFWTPSPINMFGLKRWMVTVDHKAGKQLVVKSNLELVEESKMDLSEEFYNINKWYGKMCFPMAHWMWTLSRKAYPMTKSALTLF